MNIQDLPDIFPALPSPKCVVLFGDGFSSSFSSPHPNLDKLTNAGCVGALMLRNGGDSAGRSRREFCQFLSLYDSLYDSDGKEKYELSETGKFKTTAPSFTKQNFNLQTHIITSSSTTHNFCESLEFSGLSLIPSNFAELKTENMFQQVTDILYSPQNQQTKVENVLVHLEANKQSIENGIKVSAHNIIK